MSEIICCKQHGERARVERKNISTLEFKITNHPLIPSNQTVPHIIHIALIANSEK